MSTSTYTGLGVVNNFGSDVTVYITFAAPDPNNQCCPNPASPSDFSFLTPINDLMASFVLEAGATQEFDPQGACFSGNISFFIPPQCPVSGASFNDGASGTNIAEFTLNPGAACQEAFDISCVNGINCYMTITVPDHSGWYYGPNKTPITKIMNKGLQQNSGNPGVYPVNCTDCIQLVGPAPCPSLPTGPAQKERICNVYRSDRGGSVLIILNPNQ